MKKITWQDIINFWFVELSPSDHFTKSDVLDKQIQSRFEDTLVHAKHGELYMWRNEPLGRLAEIIVLDQFSRNIYRDSPKSFEADPIALVLAQAAVQTGDDQTMSTLEKSFLYMPFMHSESLSIHEEAVKLFSQPGLENTLKYELQHKVIIEKFGRYPHRNQILSRVSTPQEIEFLNLPNSRF